MPVARKFEGGAAGLVGCLKQTAAKVAHKEQKSGIEQNGRIRCDRNPGKGHQKVFRKKNKASASWSAIGR